MDDNLIKNDYKYAMESIVSDNAEKDRAKALFDNEVSNVTRITGRSRKISKISAAVVAFVCVLALGGGTVWAMTNSPLKEFFFKNSDKQYEEISAEIGKKYEFNNIDVVLEEAIYDKSVGTGYTSFSVWDKEGNPVSIEGKLSPADYGAAFFEGKNMDAILNLRGSTIHCFNVEEDAFYIMTLNSHSHYATLDGNRIYYQFNMRDNKEEDIPAAEPEYIILNEEQYYRLYDELKMLWGDREIKYSHVNNTEKVVPFYDYDVVQPEVIEVLNSYDPVKVNIINAPAQEILADNMIFTIGRTDIVFEYNEENCDIYSFTLIRDDGSRIEFTRIEGPNSHGRWEVQGVEGRINKPHGSGDGEGQWKVWINYGFLLGADEKVTIEVNGNSYR